ncbi:Clavaminate synthase-like protein [Acaromyces ingoldii]|uniref:Clavaminate synthase-like protein n=1 Tax=Acaromyces ingoldii TaxID=215250 RepID=A0A316YYI0_9BASI|nr:Clavaminate synthase-like protein [Acaromyces ingoldii]PWN93143.1 Clavaminate synthase-like protein [Acaromyces ingoldii]
MAKAGARGQFNLAASTVTEDYIGYLPEREEGIARAAVEDLDADELWRRFVSVRRPVLIDGLAQDDSWAGQRWTDLEHLRSVAGSTQVKIEPIDAERQHFGTNAKRTQVRLDEFLDILKDPDQAGKWYMTTQYVDDEEERSSEEMSRRSDVNGGDSDSAEEDEEATGSEDDYGDGLPHVDLDLSLPPPTDALANEFPLPGPKLMGNLVLQQCNLWMGNGASGKSSGLHHDFHDNLYMLLSGRKRFLIWPPLAHRWLEPVGKLDRVHTNGLIEYDLPQQPPLRPDGLTMGEAAAWLLRARVRAMHVADEKAAQAAGEAGRTRATRKGKGRQTAEQQEALERLREAEAQVLLLQLQEEEDSDDDDEVPDWSDLDSDDLLAGLSQEEDEDDEDDDGEEEGEDGEDDEESEGEEEEGDESSPSGQARRGKGGKRQRSPPLKIPKGGLPGGLRGRLDARPGEVEEDDWDSEGEHEHFGLDEEDDDLEDGVDMVAAIDNRIAMVARLMSDSDEDEEIRGRPPDAEGESEEADDDDDNDDDDDDENEDEDEEEDEEEEINGFPVAAAEADESGSEWSNAEDGEATLDALARLQAEGVDVDLDEEDPMSFSKITPKALHWYFQVPDDPAASVEEQQKANKAFQDEHGRKPIKQRPLFPRPGCPPPVEVHLKPGQMLYLPASWYHEVTSYSEAPAKGSSSDPPAVHMALNYWFHPPSALSRRGEGGSSTGKKASSNTRDNTLSSLGTAVSPYLDPEVWDEVRTSVQEKIDEIRGRKGKSNGEVTASTTSPKATREKKKRKATEEQSEEDEALSKKVKGPRKFS